MKKRFGAALLILSMLFALAACGGAENPPEAENNKTGVTEKQPEAEDNKTGSAENQPEAEDNKTDVTENQPEAEDNKTGVTENQPEVEENKTDVTENQPEAEDNKTGVTENQPEAEDNKTDVPENQPAVEEENKTGTLDMQAAMDAYNSAAEVFNRAVIKITENMAAYPLTVIQAMGQKANDLTIYSELLADGTTLTEDQIREMVNQLAAIETWAANVEAGNLDDGNGRDLSTAIAYCNALSTDFNGIAMYVNQVPEFFSQEFINSMNETGAMLTTYQGLLDSSYEFMDEEYDQMMSDFAAIAQWLSDAEEAVFG